MRGIYLFPINLILTIGSNESVQLGQAIVRNNVYLGKISEVNLFSSKAMVITDLNSRVPVVIPSRGVNAIQPLIDTAICVIFVALMLAAEAPKLLSEPSDLIATKPPSAITARIDMPLDRKVVSTPLLP